MAVGKYGNGWGDEMRMVYFGIIKMGERIIRLKPIIPISIHFFFLFFHFHFHFSLFLHTNQKEKKPPLLLFSLFHFLLQFFRFSIYWSIPFVPKWFFSRILSPDGLLVRPLIRMFSSIFHSLKRKPFVSLHDFG